MKIEEMTIEEHYPDFSKYVVTEEGTKHLPAMAEQAHGLYGCATDTWAIITDNLYDRDIASVHRILAEWLQKQWIAKL